MMISMNRRHFFKSNVAAAVLAALPGTLSAQRNSDQTRRRVKIGFFGASHSHALEKVRIAKSSADFDLVGVVEQNEAVRQRLKDLAARFVSQEQLFAEAELVAVESDVRDHAWQTKAALEAGKHVHVEKPPADNRKDFDELVSLAKRKNRLLQLGYM